MQQSRFFYITESNKFPTVVVESIKWERGMLISDVDEKSYLISCKATCVHEEM